MAEHNQFGSATPPQTGDAHHCAQCEAMLADALDGTLSKADQAAFDLHMAGCTSCASMLADARRGAAWMEMLKSSRPEPPEALLKRIFAQTCDKATNETRPAIILGSNDRLRVPNHILGQPALAPSYASTQPPPAFKADVLPFRTRITHGLRSIGQTMLQPRLAMTAAMAFFSIALTMNLTGVRLSDLHASDLRPSSIMRGCYDAKARVVRYSDNLRVVYELESRVRDLQHSSDDDFPNNTSAPQTTPATTNPQGPAVNHQPDNQNPGNPSASPQNPDQKQSQPKPGPGSSKREGPDGNLLLLNSPHHHGTQLASMQPFVVFPPSVSRKEGGLV